MCQLATRELHPTVDDLCKLLAENKLAVFALGQMRSLGCTMLIYTEDYRILEWCRSALFTIEYGEQRIIAQWSDGDYYLVVYTPRSKEF